MLKRLIFFAICLGIVGVIVFTDFYLIFTSKIFNILVILFIIFLFFIATKLVGRPKFSIKNNKDSKDELE